MTTALFSGIEGTLLSNINKTTREIKIAVAWFTNPHLFSSLLTLLDKEKTIEIILADDAINFSNRKINFQQLIDKGVEIRISRFPKLMHNKFCIIDERLLITGSYNWTKSAEINNHENVIVSTELKLISQFNSQFIKLRKNTERLTSITSTKFNNYISEIEVEEELKIITEISSFDYDSTDKEEENNEDFEISADIHEILDKADLLYLQEKHQDAIDICMMVIKNHPNLVEAYEIIASAKWRQGKYKEQIQYAQKAVELDNQYYSAYNILGIGHAHLRNLQKSIESYQTCINAEPEQYAYYRNRAFSYLNLETDSSVPKNLRDQFTKKADLDLHKIIELTNRLETVDKSYKLYFSRGVALLNLNKPYPAKVDLLKAKELYEYTNKMQQDTHEYEQIKQGLKVIEKML